MITIDQKEYIKLLFAAKSEGGKPDKAIINFISEKLGLPKTQPRLELEILALIKCCNRI